MARIEVRQLTKVFRGETRETVRALDRLSLVVADREWLMVAGPSGCGKTTLLRLIAGLDEPDSGEIHLDGRSLAGVPPQERNIAMVFQEPALYPHMTVAENISFGLRLRRCSRAEIRQRLAWATELLELGECLERHPMELSGGQRHRVAVARALVRRPQVFLFDEPLGSLDLATREQMRRKLSEVCRATGATVIYVTHDQAEAMLMGDTIAVVKSGTVQQVGKPFIVYSHPANLFVAGFIGSMPMNLWEGKVIGDGAGFAFEGKGWSVGLGQAIAERLRNLSGKILVMGIRPEEVRLGGSDDRAPALDATVEVVEDLGADKRAHLRLGAEPLVARLPATASVRAADRVRVCFNPDAVRFFDSEDGEAIL